MAWNDITLKYLKFKGKHEQWYRILYMYVCRDVSRNGHCERHESSCNCHCLLLHRGHLTPFCKFIDETLYMLGYLGTDHLTWRGGLWFFVLFRIFFFGQHKSYNINFFCRAKREIFFHNITLGYMTKTLNQIIFFFLHQNQNIFFSNIGNQNI
jgi:hypothetical protein